MKNLTLVVLVAIFVLTLVNSAFSQGKLLTSMEEKAPTTISTTVHASEPATILLENTFYCYTAKNHEALNVQLTSKSGTQYYRINNVKKVIFITRQDEKNQKIYSFINEIGKDYVEVRVNEVKEIMTVTMVDHVTFNGIDLKGQYYFNPKFNMLF